MFSKLNKGMQLFGCRRVKPMLNSTANSDFGFGLSSLGGMVAHKN
jgi:hypothetical protein